MPYFDDLTPSGGAPTSSAPRGYFDDLVAESEKLAPKPPLLQEQQDIRRGVVRGLQDIPEGGLQLATHGLEGMTGGKFGADIIDKYIADAEAAYNKGFPSGHAPSFDVGRLGGNVAATTPFGFMAPEVLGSRVLGGAITGGVQGALQPAAPGPDFWSQKAEQAGFGGLGGAGGSAVAKGAAGAIGGITNPDVKLLMSEGVRPTPGQAGGGFLNALEEKLSSIPGLGDMISSGRRRAVEQFNTAAQNRALSHIGESATGSGREAIADMKTKIGNAYDKLLPNLTWQADPQFVNNVTNVIRDSNLLPQYQQHLATTIRQQFTGKAAGGVMTGETYKEVEEKIGKLAADYGKSLDPDQRNLGDAYKAIHSELKTALERANPLHVGELQKINAAYADMLRVQGAAGGSGAQGGIFSPAQLSASVRQMDPSMRKGTFARGEARMQDLSDAGRAVLGNKIPDSGTPGRLMAATLALGTLGGEGHHIPLVGQYTPLVAGGLAAGMGAYTSPVQASMAHILATRPGMAAPIAAAVRKLSPAAASAGGGLLATYGQ